MVAFLLGPDGLQGAVMTANFYPSLSCPVSPSSSHTPRTYSQLSPFWMEPSLLRSGRSCFRATSTTSAFLNCSLGESPGNSWPPVLSPSPCCPAQQHESRILGSFSFLLCNVQLIAGSLCSRSWGKPILSLAGAFHFHLRASVFWSLKTGKIQEIKIQITNHSSLSFSFSTIPSQQEEIGKLLLCLLLCWAWDPSLLGVLLGG